MLERILDIILFPVEWVLNQAAIFALTAPMILIFIALGLGVVIAVALIRSVVPRKVKLQTFEKPVYLGYIADEQDEREAREILAGVQSI